MTELDSLNDNSNGWGGAREGAGRPKGSMNKETIERMRVKSAFIKRVNTNADKLFNAQLDLAVGEKYLMVVRTTGEGTKQRKETEIVTDPETIKKYLDDTLDHGNDEYYFMTTKPANNPALESLLNRSFGKADEHIDLTTNGKDLPTPILNGLSTSSNEVPGNNGSSQSS